MFWLMPTTSFVVVLHRPQSPIPPLSSPTIISVLFPDSTTSSAVVLGRHPPSPNQSFPAPAVPPPASIVRPSIDHSQSHASSAALGRDNKVGLAVPAPISNVGVRRSIFSASLGKVLDRNVFKFMANVFILKKFMESIDYQMSTQMPHVKPLWCSPSFNRWVVRAAGCLFWQPPSRRIVPRLESCTWRSQLLLRCRHCPGARPCLTWYIYLSYWCWPSFLSVLWGCRPPVSEKLITSFAVPFRLVLQRRHWTPWRFGW